HDRRATFEAGVEHPRQARAVPCDQRAGRCLVPPQRCGPGQGTGVSAASGLPALSRWPWSGPPRAPSHAAAGVPVSPGEPVMEARGTGRFMIRLDGVRKRRVQGDSVFELAVPSLRVEAGQVVALLGPSGCGKSTLLDMLALVMEPTAARCFELHPGHGAAVADVRALWQHADEAALASLRRDHLGYVLQTGGLLPFLSVRENIALPGRIKGIGEQRARLERLAE